MPYVLALQFTSKFVLTNHALMWMNEWMTGLSKFHAVKMKINNAL